MNNARLLVITLLFILMIALPAMAGNGMDHGSHGGMEMGKQMRQSGMDMRNQMHTGEEGMHDGMNMGQKMHGGMDMTGKQIRETAVDGYILTYHLIDMHAQMPDNPEMAGTYHMMVSFKDSAGKPVTSAMVGYLVKGPDGKLQKTMAMTMGNSFGANVKLTEKGKYEITAKALIGGKKVMDKFTYNPVQ